jgi:hypothetical protein
MCAYAIRSCAFFEAQSNLRVICVDLLQPEDVMCQPDQLDDPKLGSDDSPLDSILHGEIL